MVLKRKNSLSGVFARNKHLFILPRNPPARRHRLNDKGMKYEMGKCIRQIIVFLNAEMHELLDKLLCAFSWEKHLAGFDVVRREHDAAAFVLAARPHGLYRKATCFQFFF